MGIIFMPRNLSPARDRQDGHSREAANLGGCVRVPLLMASDAWRGELHSWTGGGMETSGEERKREGKESIRDEIAGVQRKGRGAGAGRERQERGAGGRRTDRQRTKWEKRERKGGGRGSGLRTNGVAAQIETKLPSSG